jgi:preprotein translocase subunit YajC
VNPLVSAAYAQTAGGDSAPAYAQLLQYAPFVLIIAVFYVLWIRPQAQKQKETRSMLAALRRGDRVVTAGGIIGSISRVKEGSDEIEVEIAPNVRVNVLRDTISNVVKPKAANDAAA